MTKADAMNDEICVHVVKRKGKGLCLRYTDPVTGKRHEKQDCPKAMKAAQRAAGQWQAELRAGTDSYGRIVKWADFRFRYEEDHVFSLRASSANDVACVLNTVERVMSPDKLSRISAQWLSRFVKLRSGEGVSQATIAGDLRQLKAGLNWAKDQGYIREVPKFPKLKQARKTKAMKGRAITAEEFERMLKAVGKLPERQHESVRFLLRGLWLSGLRLGEALSLTWDQWGEGIRVDSSGEFVVLMIDAEDEKGGRDREYPVTPDFEEFLLSVPEDEREGHVFNPELYRGVCHRLDTVSKAIVKLGTVAGVKVDQNSKRDRKTGKIKTVPVFASAHDLRRAFGYRWARRVMPMVLKELMRHESVTTTEKYYVGIQAQETARHLRDVMQNDRPPTSGDRGDRGDLSGDLTKKRSQQ